MTELEIIRAEVVGMEAKSHGAAVAEAVDQLAREVRVVRGQLSVLARTQDLQDRNDCQCNVCLQLRSLRWPEDP